MRILLWPMYSASSNLNSCSTIAMLEVLLKHFLDRDPNCFVHWPFPHLKDGSDGYGTWWYDDRPQSIMYHDRVEMIEIPMIPDRMVEWSCLTRKWHDMFSQMHGEFYGYDVIITERPIAWPALYHNLVPYQKGKDARIPVFIRDPFVQGYGVGRDVMLRDYDLFLQSVGYATPDTFTQFYSQSDYNLAIRTAKGFLVPSKIRDIQKRSRVIPGGTNTAEIAASVKRYRRQSLETCLCIVDRWSGFYHPDIALDLANRVYQTGRPLKIDVITLTSPKTVKKTLKRAYGEDWGDEMAHVRFSFWTPRDTFVKLIAQADISLCLSERHSYPQGLMEALAVGAIPIWPDRPWARAVLPDDYPFLFASGKEGRVDYSEVMAMIAEVCDNLGALKAKWRFDEWVLEHFDTEQTYSELFEWIYDEVYDRDMYAKKINVGNKLRTLLASTAALLFEKVGPFTAEQFNVAARSLAARDFSMLSERSDRAFGTNPYQIKRLLRLLGWFDNGLENRPRFTNEPWGEWLARGYEPFTVEADYRV